MLRETWRERFIARNIIAMHCMLAITLLLAAGSVALGGEGPPPVERSLPEADGYRGIWYHIGDKYSGGLATYPQQIRPMAIYAPAVNKTFFCFGGTDESGGTLLHMVSYFDHATGTVPRPRILLDKHTRDAHDNPCIALDDTGHIWIFSNTHGPAPRSSIHRSVEPYSIDRFERVYEGSFSYGQPWFVPGEGFVFIHNRYEKGRAVCYMTSRDGRQWSAPTVLAQMPKGHYQISSASGGRVGVAFNYHPNGLDTRTNLYYIETRDFGRTWTTAAGEAVGLPLKDPHGDALVEDAQASGLLVYLKDIQFDSAGRPVIVYLTSKGHEPGEQNGPRTWRVARWTGQAWVQSAITTSDHNYDFGQLWLETDSMWRLIAPTDPGPQPGMTGGEVVLWTTGDAGATWERQRTITADSPRNHTYIREPVGARDDFYAFWSDGDAARPSRSFLYFTNKSGEHVWRLPPVMTTATTRPETVDTDSSTPPAE